MGGQLGIFEKKILHVLWSQLMKRFNLKTIILDSLIIISSMVFQSSCCNRPALGIKAYFSYKNQGYSCKLSFINNGDPRLTSMQTMLIKKRKGDALNLALRKNLRLDLGDFVFPGHFSFLNPHGGRSNGIFPLYHGIDRIFL